MAKGALWREIEIDALLDIVAKYLPLEQEDWIQCEYAYNQEKEAARKRSAESMKRKFSAFKNTEKLAGTTTMSPRVQRAREIQRELEIKSNTISAYDNRSSSPEEVKSQQKQLATQQADESNTLQEASNDPTVTTTSLSPSASASVSISTEFGIEVTRESVTTEENDPVRIPTPLSNKFTPTPTVWATSAQRKRAENQSLVPTNGSSVSKDSLRSTAQMSLENMTLTHSARKRKRDNDKVFEAIESINSQLLEFQNNIFRFFQETAQSRLDMKEKELQMEAEYRRQSLDLQRQTLEVARLDLEERRLDREEKRRLKDRSQQEKSEERRERTRERERERDRERDERRQERRRTFNAVWTK
ncbi:hypothetical protein EPUL_001473 [Erysiphe pulchra]|uniref:DUF6818 domain-containing protein n=1 Tax=Erysiphe pulchra TaxID=225359 RepID=A0A2S4PX26_9PEZI|nr:hypothetical protein EPUL_001473 [Erysiphe pulchra]